MLRSTATPGPASINGGTASSSDGEAALAELVQGGHLSRLDEVCQPGVAEPSEPILLATIEAIAARSWRAACTGTEAEGIAKADADRLRAEYQRAAAEAPRTI